MATNSSHLRTIVNQDGAVILDTRLGTISTLNESGAFIWNALERGDTLDLIAANLARETGEQVEALKFDVRDFVETLKEHHLWLP